MKATDENTMQFQRIRHALGGIPKFQVVGVIQSVQNLVIQSAQNGAIGKYTDEEIAAWIEWPGDAAELIEALVAGEVLARHETHRLIYRDWHKEAPRHIRGNLAKAGIAFASEDTDGVMQQIKEAPRETPREAPREPRREEPYELKEPRREPRIEWNGIEENRIKNPPNPPQAGGKERPSENKSTTAPKKVPKAVLLERFDRWYAAYPLKKSKGAAVAAWMKLKPTDQLTETMIAAVAAQTEEKRRLQAAGKFCPEWKHPGTWLNQGCWEDEAVPVAGGAGTNGSKQAEKLTQSPVTAPEPPPEAQDTAKVRWPAVLEMLTAMIDPESFETWIEPCRCDGLSPDGIWLTVPSPFCRNWIRNNFAEAVGQAAVEVCELRATPELYITVAPDDLKF